MRSLARKLRPVKLSLSFFYWMVGGALFITLSLWVTSWGLRVSQDWAKLQQQPTDATKKQFDASLDVVKAIVSGVATVATIGGGVFVLWNLRLTQTRLITERFSKAVEQLGNDKIEVRLGGIYSLERIAYDSDRDHWTIMEVLTSFIQEKSPIEEISEDQIRAKAYEIWQQSNGSGTDYEHWAEAIAVLEWKPVTKDVQAALTVIRRRQKKDPQDKNIDLSDTNLQRVVLEDADLQGANLMRANLQGVNLSRVNLQGTNLMATNLQGANLSYVNLQRVALSAANLQGANLENANLQRASLCQVNLQRANLSYVNLQEAFLDEANLEQANLREANLQGAYLTKVNLQQANLWAAELQGANLEQAKLQEADLHEAELQGADLREANLQKAILSGANLQQANLRQANLQYANLSGAVLLATDLRNAKNFDPNQPGGEQQPLLCNVALPEEFPDKDKLKDRDCAQMPAELHERYPDIYESIKAAQKEVDKARQKRWE